MGKLRSGAAACAAAVMAAVAAAVPAARAADAGDTDLAAMVRLGDVRRHMAAFQEIADHNGGDRAAGRPGYEVSVKYVAGRLRQAGFTPRIQRFDFTYWSEKSRPLFARTGPGKARYKPGRDFLTLLYSGSGDVTARAVAVDVPASGDGSSGCQASDFARFPKGAIALTQRGYCTFETKAANAQAAGAGALVLYNKPGEKGPVKGTVTKPHRIPAISASHRVGAALVKAARNGGVRLRVRTSVRSGSKPAANVIAETRPGRDDNVVLLGAHLDSVRAGPGINDNASGAATALAAAERIGALGAERLRNKVRFAWWGAEEEGLRGSEHYVSTLDDADRRKIALNLNLDMLGSVNGVRGIYDGDDSSGGRAKPPAGSGAIEKMFRDYFAGRGLRTSESAFNGRSDYGPFIKRGIPAGGIATGAEGVKTAREAKSFGGRVGKPYDPCYHAKCDTMKNVDFKLLDTNADGVAFVVQRLAWSTLPVNGAARRARIATGPAPAEPLWLGDRLLR
ncbi:MULTISPECIES: M28 family peptidase [Actinomadura]|uniref:M28 family peptidase n=2 Tax=Actinomadura yumaensis TaxID=111807 RepID=A0ABW2CYL0_9ACTN|nr:M28 family peptidase [Actinomadura sp. J1-007]MWK36371.1 M28 family peptidase [Actinomadura sp. J1-007]